MPICRSASLAAYWQVCTNLAIHSPDLTSPGSLPIFRPLPRDRGMNVNSLKSLKKRDKNCRIVRRKGPRAVRHGQRTPPAGVTPGDQCAQISTDVLRVLPPASCLRGPTGAGSNDARPRDRLADVALQYEKLAEGAEAGYHNPE
jgi:ribosomal protein L36